MAEAGKKRGNREKKGKPIIDIDHGGFGIHPTQEKKHKKQRAVMAKSN